MSNDSYKMPTDDYINKEQNELIRIMLDADDEETSEEYCG